MTLVSRTELAWAAGFLAGKGSFHLRNVRGEPRITYSAILPPDYQGDLERLAKATDISSWPTPENNAGRPPKVRLFVSGANVNHMVDMVWNYMSPRQRSQWIDLQKRHQDLTRGRAIISCAPILKDSVHHE